MQAVPAQPVETLAGHVRNFVTQRGFPVVPFEVVDGISAGASQDADGLALPGRVSFSQAARGGVEAAARRYGKRGRLNDRQVEGLRLMLHETLHQMQYARNPKDYHGSDTGDGFWEEAATEAVTQDLLPILTRSLYGHRMPPAGRTAAEAHVAGDSYAGRLRSMRQASTILSGSGNYQDYGARRARADFLRAPADVRNGMLAQVEARR